MRKRRNKEEENESEAEECVNEWNFFRDSSSTFAKGLAKPSSCTKEGYIMCLTYYHYL